jgi:hypothetical protein
VYGIRQTHPVCGRAEAHVLLRTPAVPLTRGNREPALPADRQRLLGVIADREDGPGLLT